MRCIPFYWLGLVPTCAFAEDAVVQAPKAIAADAPATAIVWVYAILLLLAIATAYMLWRRGSLRLSGNGDNRLKIIENRVIGPKQCLLVVDYEGERMLLGVSPGIIQHLCFLDGCASKSKHSVPAFETLMQSGVLDAEAIPRRRRKPTKDN